jgi:hypothetical protein
MPTPEDFAREILDILRNNNCRPGDSLPLQATSQPFDTTRSRDFNRGLSYATERQWITRGSDGGVVLTEAGYAEAWANSDDA